MYSVCTYYIHNIRLLYIYNYVLQAAHATCLACIWLYMTTVIIINHKLALCPLASYMPSALHRVREDSLAYLIPILLCPYHSGISHVTLEGGEGKREREEGKEGEKGS